MYLSHAVRTIRDDPMAGESVDLVVTLTGRSADAEAEAVDIDAEVEALGGEVVADLRFSAVHVRLPEPAVDALCELDGIDRIETAETLRLVGDDVTDTPDDGSREDPSDPARGSDRRAPDDGAPDPDRERTE